jgi:hypothetical protein
MSRIPGERRISLSIARPMGWWCPKVKSEISRDPSQESIIDERISTCRRISLGQTRQHPLHRIRRHLIVR